MAGASPEGWIYCGACGNPCRTPRGTGPYACPRCGRRLRAKRALWTFRTAAGRSSPWRAVGLIGLAAMLLTAMIGGTVARVARAEGKSVLVAGLTEDAFALDGDAIFTRTFRRLYRQSRAGGPKRALAQARGGVLGLPVLAEGWLYYVVRPWGIYEPIFEIRRVPAGGGTEERVARLENVATFPPALTAVGGRLYALANWRTPDEEWETRLLRWDGAGRREMLLARGLIRPATEYLVDRRNPDRILWLRPDELRPDGEQPGALCEVDLREQRVRKQIEVPHPYALMEENGTLAWLNDVYLRPRFSGTGMVPQFRGYAPRNLSPADEVELHVLPPGTEKPTIYRLPSMPVSTRGTLYKGHYYWIALSELAGERDYRLDVNRLALASGQITTVSHLRGTAQGPICWFLQDRREDGLYLYERYPYENWFDWSQQGLSPRQLGRIWRLKTD